MGILMDQTIAATILVAMGGTKRLLEEHEQKLAVATRIAIEAKTLELCEAHGIAYEGTGDAEASYRLGNYKFSNGQLGDSFDNRREMTDYIKRAVEDHPAEECPICAKNFAD